MSLIVEDGTGLSNANSYGALDAANTYHSDRGNTAWTGSDDAKASSLIRATSYIDSAYRSRFPGYRSRGRAQALEWPRTGAYTFVPHNGRSNAFQAGYGNEGSQLGYDYIPANVVPREILTATFEAALREIGTAGALAPDLTRDDRLKVFEVGPVHFEYFGGSNPNTSFQSIELALVSLLLPVSGFTGRAARG